MKKLALLIPFIVSGCALFGPTYTGKTTASYLLKSDTESNINFFIENSFFRLKCFKRAGKFNRSFIYC